MTEKSTAEYMEKLKNVRLSEDVRLRMKEELGSFADFHAVRVAEDARSVEEVQRNSVFTLFTNTRLRIMKATLLIALLIGTGGTSLAAQGAVPGDLLYPVKVHVNENVQSAFAFSADSEATLQAQLLDERLEEAQKLAARGKLEGETAAAVQSGITAQFQKVVEANAQASAETQAQVRVDVTESLASFNTSLEAMQSSSVETDVAANYSSAITAQINELLGIDAASSLGIEIAGDVDAATIISNAQARIEGLTTTLKNAAELGVQAKADFEADVQVAAAEISEAQASLQADAQAQAKAQAENAVRIIGEVEAALSALGDVEIDPASGGIIDLNINGSASGNATSNDGVDAQTQVDGSGDASLQDDALDAGADAGAGVTGSLGF